MRSGRSFFHAVLTLLLLLGTAGAESKPDKVEARKHSQLGKAHYNLNDWDKAIAEFKIAYDLFPDPGSLYNIAQAYRLKGKKSCASAAEYYAKYQSEEKNKRLRDSVSKVRKDMEDCAAKADEPLPVPPLNPVVPQPDGKPPANPAPINPGAAPPISTTGENALRSYEAPNLDPNRNRRILSYFVIGVGAVSMLSGVSLSLDAKGFQRKLDDCNEFDDCGLLEVRDLKDEQASAKRRAAGAYGVGSAFILGGVILYMISRKPKVDQQAGITLTPTRHGGAIGWTF